MRFYQALKKGDLGHCNLSPNRDRLESVVAKARRGHPLKPCEYLVRRRNSFGGKGETFDQLLFKACSSDDKSCGIKSKNPEKYRDRMKHTIVTSGDFRTVCKKHDGKRTLFYLDPPYPKTSTEGYHHGRDLMPADVKKVTDSLKGMVVLSYNDIPLVKKEFCRGGKYKCRRIKQEYTLNNTGEHKPVTELLITKGI